MSFVQQTLFNIQISPPANDNETGVYRRNGNEKDFYYSIVPEVETIADLWDYTLAVSILIYKLLLLLLFF